MERWMMKLARMLLPLLVVTLVGCGVTGAEPSPTSSPSATMAASLATIRMSVSLGIYSGRPDPSWDLTAAQATQVQSAIAALPVTTGTPAEGGLGYHGFTLLVRRPGLADATLVAYRGTVAPLGVGPRQYSIDYGRTVERLLLDLGRPMLTTTEVAAVEADLAAEP